MNTFLLIISLLCGYFTYTITDYHIYKVSSFVHYWAILAGLYLIYYGKQHYIYMIGGLLFSFHMSYHLHKICNLY